MLAQVNSKKIAELAILLPLVQVFLSILSDVNSDGLGVINFNLPLSTEARPKNECIKSYVYEDTGGYKEACGLAVWLFLAVFVNSRFPPLPPAHPKSVYLCKN